MELEEILSHKRDKKNYQVSGIYYLIKGDEIVYVGQARNIFSRISTHIMEKEKDFDYCTVISIPYENLSEVETEEIFKHRPIYNTNIPRNNIYKTFKQLLPILGMSVHQLRKFIITHKIEPVALGGLVFYKISDFYKE